MEMLRTFLEKRWKRVENALRVLYNTNHGEFEKGGEIMSEVTYTELPETVAEDQVVKPVALAKELGVAPQIVYGWIRTGGLKAYTRGGEGRYILRDEFSAWQEEKERKKAEREQRKAERARSAEEDEDEE